VHKILKYGGAVNPTDVLVSLVKGGEVFRFVRLLQLYWTSNWEVSPHGFEFVLSPKLVDQAHIWVLPFRL